MRGAKVSRVGEVRRLIVGLLVATILTLVALAAVPLLTDREAVLRPLLPGGRLSGLLAAQAQPGYAVALPTESNNQHKLAWHDGRLYVTYSKVVGRMPRIFVDVSADSRTRRSLGQVSRGDAPATLSTLALDPQGRIHVAWTAFDRGIGRVFYSRSDRATAGGWAPPLALSSPTAYAGYPSMDVDPGGRLHLAWYGIREASAGQPVAHGAIYEIFYVTHPGRPDGRWSAPLRLSGGFPDSINPALAVDNRGRVHVVWFQSDGQAYQITYGRRDGTTWSAPVALTSGPRPATKPAIALDGDGRVHIVWERSVGGRTSIHYMSGGRDRWTSPVDLSLGSGRHPTVAIRGQRVVTLWQGEDGSIRVRALDRRAGGTAWARIRRLRGGDYPNASPWKPSPGARLRAVLTNTITPGIDVIDLE